MLDENNCRYIYNGKIIELSVLESKILRVLIDNKYRVIKYNELLLELYGSEEKKRRIMFENTVIKKKIKRNIGNKNKSNYRVLYKLKK